MTSQVSITCEEQYRAKRATSFGAIPVPTSTEAQQMISVDPFATCCYQAHQWIRMSSGLSGMGEGGVEGVKGLKGLWVPNIKALVLCIGQKLRTWSSRGVEVIWRGGKRFLVVDRFGIWGPNDAARSWSGIVGRFLPMQQELLTRFKGVVDAPPLGGVLVKRWGGVGGKDIKREGWVLGCYEKSSIDQKATDLVVVGKGGKGYKE
ncbi:hypothetical protein F5146DRAFT_999574 [Armillaria mellea]|nr:hypothetical protein F5146DRAFT_999574 [Armillaria mellea]